MRASSGFRMILHAKRGMDFVANAFHRVVIQADMSHLNIVRQRVCIESETVVL